MPQGLFSPPLADVMKKILETERLALYDFEVEDAPFVQRLVNSPGWLRFIGDRHIHTLADAELYLLNSIIPVYKEFGFGFWQIRLKDTDTPIGMCGITKRIYLNNPDLGYALLPQYEGKGYAYEAVVATIAYARDTLHLPRLLAIARPDNAASIKLLEKASLRFEKTLLLPYAASAEVQMMSIDF